MKNKIILGLLFSIALLNANLVMAQTDVTASYLSNAGFNEQCNYLVGETQILSTANTANMGTVIGWNKGGQPAWSVSGTFEYGWNGTFNGTSSPASGDGGASGSGQGAVGFTVGWTGSISYTQTVTLPMGKYGIVYAFNLISFNNISSNLTGWVPNSGTAVLASRTTVPTLNTWVKDTIRFNLSEATTGIIQVGMQAYNSGSGNNARMFVDYIKILKYVGDKTKLQNLSDSATVMYNNQQNVPVGSTVYTDLATAISDAQIVLDNEDASDELIISAEGDLEVAIENVHVAILEYSLSDASFSNPINLTNKIINPDFEDDGGSTFGWTTTLGIYNGANTIFNGASSPNHVLDGDPISATTGYQTIHALPKGIYKVKTIARGRIETNGSKMYLGATGGSTFSSADRVSVQIDRIGDSGGDLNYGFNQYETPFVILKDGVTTLTTGIYFSGDCGWSSADNFELYYYGYADSVVNSLKQILTALKDSSDMPSSYDLTAINTLLNTTPTDENVIALLSGLEQAIADLEVVIAQNMDPTLSDLLVNGKTIRNFSSSLSDYNYNIYITTPGIPPVPVVTATKNSVYSAEPLISDATQVPGTTTITVTAGNGNTKTYTITFASILQVAMENYNATVESITNQFLKISGTGQLTITGTNDPLSGSAIDLVSTDAWVYFPNIKPSVVVASLLSSFLVNGNDAVNGSNIWVAQYLDGAMVIPHSNSYKALTVYSGSGLSGTPLDFTAGQIYKATALGSLNDNIESFVLKKGYMATFASNENGTGKSRVYIAKERDIIVNLMPQGLSNTVSMIALRKWRWTTKKGWRGSASGADLFQATSHYDYNNAAYSTLDVEYVPMRHNPNWNAYTNFLDKFSSTHALGYNEPDNSVDDGYSTVADALTNWPNMMASGLRLGSPAPTDGGLNWLYEFLDQCDILGYRVDFVAWHFYRRSYTAQGLYDALKAIYDRTGRPLWITEFNNGCNWTYDASHPVPSIETNAQVIESFIQMLDTTSFVERYFVWDGCNETLRMTNSGTGELYPAGVAYRDNESPMSYTKDFYNGSDIVKIQENGTGFCGLNGTIDTGQIYTGSGFANTADSVGSGINYKVIFKTEGFKTIYVQYASTSNRPANIIVNGEIVASDIQFPSTGSLDVYANLPIMINAGTGITDIRIEATTSEGLANIDFVEITDAKAASCALTTDSYPVVLTATSQQAGNPAEKLLDGNTGDASRWSASGFPHSVVIDYGTNKSIIGTRVSTYLARAYQFTVELDDDADFSSPYTVDRTSNTSTVQPISNNFPAVVARYARITVTGASGYTGPWVSLTEFNIVEGTASNIPSSANNKFIIYPNPAENQLNIIIQDNFKVATLFIYNNTGYLVKKFSISSSKNTIHIDDLASGIYIVKLQTDNEVVAKKINIK